MGHTRADVFRRHYMHQTVKVDTQNAYLGTTNRGDLIKTVGLMSNKRDPRAPVKLGAENLKTRQLENPELTALIVRQNRLVDTLKAECGTVKEVRTLQPEEHQEYTKLSCGPRGRRARTREERRAGMYFPLSFPFATSLLADLGGRRKVSPTGTAGYRSCAEERRTGIGPWIYL